MIQFLDSVEWHRQGGSFLGYMTHELISRVYGNPSQYTLHNRSGWLMRDNRPLLLRLLQKIENSNLVKYIDSLLCNERKTEQHWHTIFDWSTGTLLDSREKVRDMERSGKTRVSVKDWEIEHNKLLKRQEQEHEKHIAVRLAQMQKEIAQGRSFVKEKKEYNKRIEREHGIKIKPRYQ